MRKYTQKETVQENLEQVFCNCCGKEIPKDHFGYFHDYVHIEKQWNYFSQKDGEQYTFDICESCFDAWIKGFSISPQTEQESFD